MFLLHGAGYTGASFAGFVKEAKKYARCFAIDFRGHGLTTTDNQLDLSAETLTRDTVSVIQRLHCELPNDTLSIVIGHSMGGGICVRACATGGIPNLRGCVVIDVVEGTAIASLSHMNIVLANRPSEFESIKEAIKWEYNFFI